jgi:hypothetical protein
VQQIGVHHARNLRRVPLLGVGILGAAYGTKLPARVQGSRRRLCRYEWQRSQQQKEM